MKKFAVYADRNIFIANQQSPPSSATQVNDKDELMKAELKAATEEVQSLKEEYLSLRANHVQLASECRDGDLLLKDMRKSLFTIRVGAQTLDECKVQPLIETVAILEQHQQTMVDLTARANGKKNIICAVIAFFFMYFNCIRLSSLSIMAFFVIEKNNLSSVIDLQRQMSDFCEEGNDVKIAEKDEVGGAFVENSNDRKVDLT